MKKMSLRKLVGSSSWLFILMVGCFMIGVLAFAPPARSAAADKLVFTSLPPGTKWYTDMVSLSQIVNRYSDLVTIVQPVPAPPAMTGLVQAGQAHLGMDPSDSFYYTVNGLGGNPGFDEGYNYYKGKPLKNLRILVGADTQYYALFTTSAAGIKTIPDLKGKKVAGYFPGWAVSNYTNAMLLAYGLDPKKDVQMVKFGRTTQAVEALIAGKVDAVCTSLAGAKIVELEAKAGIVVLPFDPSKIDFLKKIAPTVGIGSPPPYTPGMPKDKSLTVSTNRNYLYVNKNLDEKAAYTLAKTILEHAAELARVADYFQEYNVQSAVVNDFIAPYHPGAVKYFKEKGVWTDAHEMHQKDLLKQFEN
ncbi:MAG: TAXI family TRAP transporter solute-binding subunit [Desulfobacterales bacterium]|nr:TAXI family TRAP transporter solute-binding subunit [Desulfobacterales bacterium]